MNKNWKKAIIPMTASARDAVECINQSGLKTAIIVDDQQKLIGIVTDGDVRRAILKGIELSSNVIEIANKTPVLGSIKDSTSKRIELMQERQLVSLPIIDESGCVAGLDLFSELVKNKSKDNAVFLMAGGFGSRLSPLTDDCPKPLLPVGEKPILELILERFVNDGFENFYISLHYLPEKIKDYFGDGEKWGVNINYVYEHTPLGTAGALSLLPQEALNQPIVMMNGDLLTKLDFNQLLETHEKSNSIATVGVRQYDFQVPYGVITHTDGKIDAIVEKPTHQFFVNAGVYILNPKIIQQVEKDSYLDMPTLLKKQIDVGNNVDMFPIHEYWLDIGQKNDFEKAQREFGEKFIL